jgi:LacI family gluconate utilization system Gnt-I transcriptional repressor
VGVSKMTVSRALKRTDDGGSPASQALRQRILAACDAMGYVIDQTARTFSTQRSGFVAALIPSLNNSNFNETAHGLSTAIEAAGLQLLLGSTDYRTETEARLVHAMLTRRPEGVVLTGGSHTPATRARLRAAGIPVVETWDLPADPIEHVYSEAIAALGGAGVAVEGRVISFGQPPISMEQGGQALLQLVRQWPEVDAVVCVSDLSAFGALAECQRQGWAVPGRIAIAGFGDFEVARTCHPRITTVAVDCAGIGRAAGELLLRAIDAARAGQRLPAETLMIPFRIVEREST